MPRILCGLLLAAAAAAIGPPQARAVQIVSGSMSSTALDPRTSSTSAFDVAQVTQLPFHDTTQAVQGSARNTTDYEFFTLDDTTTFDIAVAIRIPESYGPSNVHGQARSSGNVFISLPSAGTYNVTGRLNTSGVLPQVDMRVQIRDATNANIFHSNRRSEGPNNVPRAIDPASPTGASTWVGSPSGLLPAGNYRLSYDIIASNGFTPNAIGDLTGNLTFEITLVPEPSTFALAGLGVLGVFLVGRRRRSIR